MAENKSVPAGANKYSVYAQRDVESTQIDWGKVATDLGKNIEDIRLDRDRRKDELETINQNAIEELSKIQDTNNQDAAGLVINGSAMSVDSLMVQYKLLKRGKISPREFKLAINQQKNAYTGLNNAVKGWDGWSTIATERITNGEAGFLEIRNNVSVEGLGNIKNKKLWTNPINNKMYLVSMGKDKDGLYTVMPDYKTEPSKFQNPTNLGGLMKYQQNKFNLTEASTKLTDPIAKMITASIGDYSVFRGGQEITSIEDFRQLGDFAGGVTYDDWKEAQINALVGSVDTLDNQDAAQVLANSGPYEAEKTIEEFRINHPGLDEKYFIEYSTESGRAEATLKPEQQKEARRLANIEIESQITHQLDIKAAKSGQKPDKKNSLELGLERESATNIGYLQRSIDIVSGDMSKFSSSSKQGIQDINQRLSASGVNDQASLIDSIKRQGDMITVTYQNGKKESIERKTGDGSFRSTKDVSGELFQLIAPSNTSYDDTVKAFEKAGKSFNESTRDMSDKEITDGIRMTRATDNLRKEEEKRLKGESLSPEEVKKEMDKFQPTTDALKKELDEVEISSADLQKAKDEGQIRTYTGEDAVSYSSRNPYKVKSSGENIIQGEKGGVPTITGVDSLRADIGLEAGETDLPTYYGSSKSKSRKKAIDGGVTKVLKGYLPRALKGSADVSMDADTENLVVKYKGKALTIPGVTDVTINNYTSIVALDEMLSKAAAVIGKKGNDALSSRGGGGSLKGRASSF